DVSSAGGGGNKTLVVLSDEIAVEDLSEAGFSPERLAEALANALESVIGDEDGGEVAEEGESAKTETDDAAAAPSSEESEESEDGDPKGSDGEGEEGEPAIAPKADASEDKDSEVSNLSEGESEEDTHGQASGPEDAAQARDAMEEPEETSEAPSEAVIEDQHDHQPSGDGDTRTSFLGQYFSTQGRSPGGSGASSIDASEDDATEDSEDSDDDPKMPEPPPDSAHQPENFLEVLPRYGPREIIQWQRSRERLVLLGLQRFSHQTNQILRTTNAMPEPLGAPLLEGELSLTRDASLKTPNLMAMNIRPTKKKRSKGRPKSTPFRMVAIHLNLNDLELANPDLSRRSRQIRTLFNQIEQLNQRHQDLHRKLTIAQADQAWRSSWSGDT
ncbi:MAG: hypothetical protein AAGF75_09135, partial [Cyanobacteria bacterium P01_H01_bin.130]